MKYKSLTVFSFLACALMGGLLAEGASGGAGAPSASAALSKTAGSSEEVLVEVAPDPRMVLALKNFYGKLHSDYGYEPQGEPIANFEEGAPALTRESLRLALQGPLAASHSLVLAIDALSRLIDDLEAGRLGRAEFKVDFGNHLERIDSLARVVEKDEYLRLIDLGPDLKGAAPETAQSMESFRLRVAELNRVAKQMQDSLSAGSHEDTTQVVSVQRLSQPSFRTLCQGIERLAVSLRSSIEGL